LVAGFARALHKGRGHLRDTVEGVRTEDEDTRGLGALHLAAGSGKLDMCPYLVEVLGVDVDAVDHGGSVFPSHQNPKTYCSWRYDSPRSHVKFPGIYASKPRSA
jgi:hypothetical protein